VGSLRVTTMRQEAAVSVIFGRGPNPYAGSSNDTNKPTTVPALTYSTSPVGVRITLDVTEIRTKSLANYLIILEGELTHMLIYTI
jgi:hypothetical protein